VSLVGFRGQNHPQQVGKRGANGKVDDRSTRWEDFNPLHERFNFTIDVAASADNAKLSRYYTVEDNGLSKLWTRERVWCNPPYSDIGAWVQKAWVAMGDFCELVVMLLPANRTEQRWWQEHVEPYRDGNSKGPIRLGVEFLPGRMRFDIPGGYDDPRGNRPPFGCCLLIWESEWV
jgi:phage N-6-adenine-methyltransferase